LHRRARGTSASRGVRLASSGRAPTAAAFLPFGARRRPVLPHA